MKLSNIMELWQDKENHNRKFLQVGYSYGIRMNSAKVEFFLIENDEPTQVQKIYWYNMCEEWEEITNE